MSREEFLKELDGILEAAPGTLKGPEKLHELERWDSTALIGFIALADTHGTAISPRQVVNCVTVNDLLRLAAVVAS